MPFKPDSASNFKSESTSSWGPEDERNRKVDSLQKWLPVITSMLGGVGGPVGTGMGYSMGNSIQNVMGQMRGGGNDVLAQIIGKSRAGKMTPYGQQRYEEMGVGNANVTPEFLKQVQQSGAPVSENPGFNIGKEAINNLDTQKYRGDVEQFLGKNAIGTGINTLTDALMSGFMNQLRSGLVKNNALWGVKGTTPKQMVNSADDLARNQYWKPIQEGLDSADAAGSNLNTTEMVNILQGKIDDINSTYKYGKPQEALDEILGYQNVIDSLKAGSRETLTSLGDEGVSGLQTNLKAGQGTKSLFGKQSFSPITKAGKESSAIQQSAELTGKRLAGPELQKEVIKELQKAGIENADELFKGYGKLTNFSDTISRKPLSGAMEAGVTGAMTGSILSLMGASPQSSAIPLLTFLAMTPLGRQYMRQIGSTGMTVLPYVSRAVTSGLTNEAQQ